MAGVCLYTIITSQSQYIALKKKKILKDLGGGGGEQGAACTMCIIGRTKWAYCNSTK